MPTPYQRNCPINRTVIHRIPLGLVDFQGLPPYGWCEKCGAEVYRPVQTLCFRCRK